MTNEQMHERFREVVNNVYAEYGLRYNETGIVLTIYFNIYGFMDRISWCLSKTHDVLFSPFVVREQDLETVVNVLKLRLLLKGFNFKVHKIEELDKKPDERKKVAVYFTDGK